MANQPGKKAELDKDGIAYDIGKAQLDKEGMTLSDEKKADVTSQAASPEASPETAPPEKPSRRKLILIASIASSVVFLILVAGVVTYMVTKKEPASEAPVVASVKPTPPPSLDSPSGELTLDPFMVLYTPNTPKESGVLLAQLSLQVSPEIAYTIGSQMFEIRNLIYQRLSANAEVYSKTELLSMLREDLKVFNIRDVGFIQFEKR